MSVPGQELQVVVFGLGAERFALPVTEVREILDHRPAFRMPDTPEALLGLTDVRGTSVPMIDLRVRLGLPAADPTPATRVLVVEAPVTGAAPLLMGLVVDRVIEVGTFGADAVERSPDLGGRWRSGQVDTVLRREDGFIALLDPSTILDIDQEDYLASAT